jgi:hypothetical protein
MIQPNITHLPCDLNQQRKREEARTDSLARAVLVRGGHRSLLDRLRRRRRPAVALDADARPRGVGEDVFHAFRL